MAYGEERGSRRARRREELGIPNEGALLTDAIDSGLADDPPPVPRPAPDPTGSTAPRSTTQPVTDPTGVNAPTGVPTPTTPTSTSGGQRSYDYIPGSEGQTWGDTSRLSGFNTNEWGEGGTEGYDEYSYKNNFGKIATHLDPTPDNVRSLFGDGPVAQQFRARFPNAILVDHPTDPKIQFESGDPPVDVLIASGAGGWGWQPGGPGGGAEGSGGAPGTNADGDLVNSPPITAGDDAIDALSEGDLLKRIQAALAAAGRGETPELDDRLKRLI
jgi:hypothetical protein